MRISYLISSSVIGLAFALPAQARAQSQPAQPAATSTPDRAEERVEDAEYSDEIIVTATRRRERLQDVPLSVTAFQQAELTQKGIVGYEGLARDTPGVVLNKPTANFNNFTSRGIATNGYGANLQSTVTVYIDELPISTVGNSTVIDPNLFDTERVEFLRGPQGTLFGANSLSGALRILNRNADLNTFDSSMLLDFGLTGSDSWRSRANAMINVPLAEDVAALRVVGFYRYEMGYLDNLGTGKHNANTLRDFGGRAVLRVEPTERLSMRFLASYENNAPQDSSLTDPTMGREKRYSFRPDRFTAKLQNYNATIDYQFDGARLTSSSTYSHYFQQFNVDISNAIANLFPYAIEATGPQKTFVQEARLISDPGGNWDWVIGGFFLDRKLSVSQIYRTTADFLNARGITGARGDHGDEIQALIYDAKSREMAGFGELTYRFNDRLWITGGMRYGRTEAQLFLTEGNYVSTFLAQGLRGIGGPLTFVPVAPATRPKVGANRLSWKGSISFRPVPELTTYATVSTGFRAPVFNANYGRVSVVDPNDIVIPERAKSDDLVNYEIGAKGRFFDGKLTANIAAYYIDWNNIQVQANRVSDSIQFATNIGKGVSKGVEFEIFARPIPALSFGINGSVNDAKVTKLSPEEAAISGAVDGVRLSSPHLQGSAFAQVDFDLGSGSGFINATVQHVGSFPNTFPYTPGRPGVRPSTYDHTDAYENVNLSVGAKFDAFSATLYVENLFDDHSTTYIHPEAFFRSRYGTLRPRTVGIRISRGI